MINKIMFSLLNNNNNNNNNNHDPDYLNKCRNIILNGGGGGLFKYIYLYCTIIHNKTKKINKIF